MSVVALPGGMLGARSRLRPLPMSLVGWCASCNNNGVGLGHNPSVRYCLIVVEGFVYLNDPES